jgi:DNA-binding NarL/FixJ family response regulator
MNVLLVDDHYSVRKGLALTLRGIDSQLHVDEAGNCAEATAFAGGRYYDLILLDLNMPGVAGLEALAVILGAFRDSPVVVVSAENDPHVVRQAIAAGAMGYVPKTTNEEITLDALRRVLEHSIYVPPNAQNVIGSHQVSPEERLLDDGALEGLTKRQKEVVEGVIQGKSNKEIARELGISDSTVKMHLSLAMRALNAARRTQVVSAAAKKLGMRLV